MINRLPIKPTYSMNSSELFKLLWEAIFLNKCSNLTKNTKILKTHVLETNTEFIVYADIPTILKEDITISYENNFLILTINEKTNSMGEENQIQRLFYMPNIDISSTSYNLEKNELALSVKKL